jgi:hypothetical protein
MPALDNPKREAFAQALLKNLIGGEFKFRGEAAFAAAKTAGYRGSALKDNARKWANEADVKSRMAEIAGPVKPEVDEDLMMSIGEAKLMLARIARHAKASDRIGSIRQLSMMEGWEAPKRMEHTGANGERLLDPSKLNDDQLAALENIVAALASDDPGGAEIPPSEGQLH